MPKSPIKFGITKYPLYTFIFVENDKIINTYCSLCVSNTCVKSLIKLPLHKIKSKSKCFVCGYNILDMYTKIEEVLRDCSSTKWKKLIQSFNNETLRQFILSYDM